MSTKAGASVEDLYQVKDHSKAEIVNGEIVLMSPTGAKPGRAAMRIAASLSRHEQDHGGGYAFGDNVGFIVTLPHRQSFSPDAAWYIGSIDSMDFLKGAPAIAAEIRSKNDYGAKAEAAIIEKIRDYFASGSKVVWDVDLLGDIVIRVYRSTDPDHPAIYKHGDLAEAEPAVSGWQMTVNELFS